MLDNNTGLGLNTGAATATATAADMQSLIAIKLKLESQLKNSAGWFFAIAGLSLVNSILLMTGARWHFFFGLGITDVVEEVARNLGSAGQVAALVVNVFIATILVLFGVFARKGQKWAFIVGMVAYAIDGLLFLLARDFLGLIVHGYALYAIYRGIKAIDPLQKIARATLATTPRPIEP
jgi:hypothetical protein